jgi:peptide deformylase
MAIIEIKKYPDKILKEKTAVITDLDAGTQHLINDMIETLHSVRGLGLAANQVGVSRRLCVIDCSSKEDKGQLIILVNPLIIEKEGTVESEEGCLSIPGYITSIKRAEKVFVRGLDREGRQIELEATGLLARALQHEVDHLDGLLLIDRMSAIKREFFKRRYKKSLQETKK